MAAPKRELFKAAEVCDVVQVQAYVLRSWEAEFPQLGRASTPGGPRVYRRADVELALKIKQLVFEEGLTLAGARRRLDDEDTGAEEPGASMADLLDDRLKERVRNVRDGLRDLLSLLSSEGATTQSELKLVAPAQARRARKK